MLIDFKVTNFRSIKEKQELSMLPVGKVSEYPSHLIHTYNKTDLLRSLIIYGRNASGKSNLLSICSIILLSKKICRIQNR